MIFLIDCVLVKIGAFYVGLSILVLLFNEGNSVRQSWL